MQYIPEVASKVASKLSDKNLKGFSPLILPAIIAIVTDIVNFIQQCINPTPTPTPIPAPTNLKEMAARHPVIFRSRARRFSYLRLREYKQPTEHFVGVADTILEQVNEMDNQSLVNVVNDVVPHH